MIYNDEGMVEFTALDRCDRCGAQAYSVAARPEILAELLFCMHHRNEFGPALDADGWNIIDSLSYAELSNIEPVVY